MKILGIETSCDETAVSVIEAGGESDSPSFKLLGSAVHSQIDLHRLYGGVVPNLAKREHRKNLLPVLIEALREASLISNDIQMPKEGIENENIEEKWREFLGKIKKPEIDLIVVTVGPGLEPALWTGINFAEELGKKWEIPVIGANHMEGHIASVLPGKTDEIVSSVIEFPAIALLVSGGHTELVHLKNWAEKEKVGETLDDAVGEAFDKVARMLGLPYPGGPEISRLAEEARGKNIRLETRFPRPMIHSKDLNFSFSGLKTAVLYHLRDAEKLLSSAAVAREFEDAVVETLISKTKDAIEKFSPKTLIIGGGVIANKFLRENMLKLNETYPELKILIPEKSLATDNATMIALAGFFEYKNKAGKELRASGNLDI